MNPKCNWRCLEIGLMKTSFSALALPRDLLEMQILRIYPRHLEYEFVF